MAVTKRRWQILDKDRGREPFMINSPIIIANPRKTKEGSVKAKRNSKGRFVKNSSSHKVHHHKKKRNYSMKRKRNYVTAGALLPNRPKRRKKNPGLSLAGFSAPVTGEEFAFLLAGLSLPDMLDLAVQDYRAAQTKAGQPVVGTWADPANQTMITAGEYIAPLLLAYFTMGKKAATFVAIGEAMAIAYNQIFAILTGNPTSAASTTKGYLLPRQPAPNMSTAARLSGSRGVAGYIMPRSQGVRGYPTSPDRLAKRYGSWGG